MHLPKAQPCGVWRGTLRDKLCECKHASFYQDVQLLQTCVLMQLGSRRAQP